MDGRIRRLEGIIQDSSPAAHNVLAGKRGDIHHSDGPV